MLILMQVRPLAMKWALFTNPFPTGEAKSAQIHTWWHEAMMEINPASCNVEPTQNYITMVSYKYHL
jgi:hypothetical protein